MSRKFFLLRSMSRALKFFSSALMAWLTADWLTPLIWAAWVKLSVSARSQNTFRLSNCMAGLNRRISGPSIRATAALTTHQCRRKNHQNAPPMAAKAIKPSSRRMRK